MSAENNSTNNSPDNSYGQGKSLREDFSEDPIQPNLTQDFIVNLDSYEGPLDMLLALARNRQFDLAALPVLALADQYLDFIRTARDLRIELAADYLVMAAWLTWLKSRLLLGAEADDDAELSPQEESEALARKLQHLAWIRKQAAQIFETSQILGQDIFARGITTQQTNIENITRYHANLADLFSAYGDLHHRGRDGLLRISPTSLYSADSAMKPLLKRITNTQNWQNILTISQEIAAENGVIKNSAAAENLQNRNESGGDNDLITAEKPAENHDKIKEIAEGEKTRLLLRSYHVAFLLAGLESVRLGKAELKQEMNFAPLYIRGRENKQAS